MLPILGAVPPSKVTSIPGSRKTKSIVVANGPRRPLLCASEIPGVKASRAPFRRIHNITNRSGGKSRGKADKVPSPHTEVVPSVPCSPEARLKSPTRMPLPPTDCTLATVPAVANLDADMRVGPNSPQFKSLPDPFAELEAIERIERIENKDELGPSTMSRMSRIKRRINCRVAIRRWYAIITIQRQKDHMAIVERLRRRSAGRVIVRAWRMRMQKVAEAKQAAATFQA